jgi:hypothetical protein
MAERTGKCTNFGLCSKADSREIIPIAGGGDFSCPECGKPLTEAAGAAAPGQGSGNSGGGKKAIAIGALGLALIAGTAYKYLSGPAKDADTPAKGPNIGVQDTTTPPGPSDGPVLPQEQKVPGIRTPKRPGIPAPDEQVLPPSDGQVIPPHNGLRKPRHPGGPPIVTPPVAEEEQQQAAAPVHGTMVARLLSAINTHTANEGDTFTAKLENGPYRGGILSGSIKRLKKGRKNCELELAFNKLNGKPIPVGLDLVSITNAQGVKGVDDENNKISGTSSKKKVAIVTAVGGAIGGVIGAIKGGKKGAVIGTGAGAGAGFLLSMTVMSRAQDIDLQPGSRLTLRSSSR